VNNNSKVKVVQRLYQAAAISNFAVTLPAFLSYRRYVASFTDDPPNYPFLVWIWSGMAFLWGVSFWEISRNPVKKYSLMKYSYIEKSITATSVTTAFLAGNVPRRFLAGISFTDTAWVPLFLAAHRAINQVRRELDPVSGLPGR
jgi:hypothetical protein